jgi:uncharacterized protein YecE (DUF72 family)
MIKIGCCGFPKSMKDYFTEFDVGEVQKTFYEPPGIETLKKWHDQAPEGFEFTVKAWQVITHPPSSPTYKRTRTKPKDCGFFKPTREVYEAWGKMLEVCGVLRTKIVLFQCPASFKPSDENIKNIYKFFGSIKSTLIHVWEPRGNWSDEGVKEICEELNLVHCVDPFKNKQQAGTFNYYRLHGIGGYHYQYTKGDLEKLLSFCSPSSYVLFNNMSMVENAIEFKKRIEHSACHRSH